ncbi:Protease Do-like 5, chloroplastic [Stylosanthes scabra]|uniref:Protease Do-like 5, chloroplastic n=1 Tax=Stylosanthes scabra TaxID=79078 RepID=A0ABU6R8T4_9FABA|nr:Protease Do-like 5, chloroplastic [Stylosanthes scabra]
MALLSLQSNLSQLPNPTIASTTKTIPSLTRRGALAFASSILASSCLAFSNLNPTPLALAQNHLQDELEQQEHLLVHLFEETSPSVVFIKDIELSKVPTPSSNQVMMLNEDADAKVEGTGSGFIWDQFGHVVTNYHVVAKLATDTSGLQRCKVFLVDAKGNSFFSEGKIIGFDPDYDLAVLKIDVDGHEIRPVVVGQSKNLHVGQSCFAIGNPYGYENTLTTGVVSGLGREIPSPNGRAIKGAIQTDADINAGNSGGPLIDSYGHVIGVNTATFTRKGSGMSSGVNFAIPIDTVMRTVPYLIVYGTPYSNRF